jgi:hypothetical protein
MLRRTVLGLPLALAMGAALVATPAQAAPAVQHAAGDVHLATLLQGNQVDHTIRYADGSWQDARKLTAAYRVGRNLVSTIVNGEEHLLFDELGISWVGSYNMIRHADGTWESNYRPGLASSPGGLAVAAVSGELNEVRLDSWTSAVLRTRHSDGTWTAPTAVPVTTTATTSFSAAGSGGELRFVITNPTGTSLSYLVRDATGTWSPATDVPFTVPGVTASTVDIAQIGAELQAVVLGSDAQLYHSIRHANGVWDTFNNVGPAAGDPGTPISVSVTASTGTFHLAIATSEGGVHHTIRFANGTWQPFGDVEQAAGGSLGSEVTIAGE